MVGYIKLVTGFKKKINNKYIHDIVEAKLQMWKGLITLILIALNGNYPGGKKIVVFRAQLRF